MPLYGNPNPLYVPYVLGGKLIGANFNSTADQAIPIASPHPKYRLAQIVVANASISLTTAQGGLYSAASKGGTTLVANTQAYITLTGAAVNSAGSVMLPTVVAAPGNTTLWDIGTIYFSLTTPQGAPATADIYIIILPLPIV